MNIYIISPTSIPIEVIKLTTKEALSIYKREKNFFDATGVSSTVNAEGNINLYVNMDYNFPDDFKEKVYGWIEENRSRIINNILG